MFELKYITTTDKEAGFKQFTINRKTNGRALALILMGEDGLVFKINFVTDSFFDCAKIIEFIEGGFKNE